MSRIASVLCLTASVLAADHSCPAYPADQRRAMAASVDLQRWAARMAKPATQARAAAARNNWIDEHIFGRMERDGVEPAPTSGDAEFLRRVSIDLTGRIPSPEQIENFLADSSATKREALVESLINSPGFVDQWTLYFGNRFQVTSNYYRLVGIPGRNLFNRYLRDFVSRDRSWSDLATELISFAGDTHQGAPGNLLMRGIQQGDPIQDTWDTLTNTVTTEFLGVQTQCVSCHDGRRHLEDINLYLLARRREQFMEQSAFFARMNIAEISVDAFGQQAKGIVTDRQTGVYHGVVPTQNPGARPARIGTYEPAYMFTGERARNNNWRRELARMITADRQFARAAVNYIWAYFFRSGIVDPPFSWDLLRIDPKNPPPAPWPLQAVNPELLEALADSFIQSGYRFRPLIRLIANSGAYQLSSRYGGAWRPEYASYFAKHVPRRLSAEEIYDALIVATMTEAPMQVEGFLEPLSFANQLPDPSEPRDATFGGLRTFLANLGRGDWWQTPRTSEASVVQVLYLMNDNYINMRTYGPGFGGNQPFTGSNRVSRLLASQMTDLEIIRQLFLATLGRPPSDAEVATMNRIRNPNRELWLTNIQWALLNRAEFLFNN